MSLLDSGAAIAAVAALVKSRREYAEKFAEALKSAPAPDPAPTQAPTGTTPPAQDLPAAAKEPSLPASVSVEVAPNPTTPPPPDPEAVANVGKIVMTDLDRILPDIPISFPSWRFHHALKGADFQSVIQAVVAANGLYVQMNGDAAILTKPK